MSRVAMDGIEEAYNLVMSFARKAPICLDKSFQNLLVTWKKHSLETPAWHEALSQTKDIPYLDGSYLIEFLCNCSLGTLLNKHTTMQLTDTEFTARYTKNPSLLNTMNQERATLYKSYLDAYAHKIKITSDTPHLKLLAITLKLHEYIITAWDCALKNTPQAEAFIRRNFSNFSNVIDIHNCWDEMVTLIHDVTNALIKSAPKTVAITIPPSISSKAAQSDSSLHRSGSVAESLSKFIGLASAYFTTSVTPRTPFFQTVTPTTSPASTDSEKSSPSEREKSQLMFSFGDD